MPFAYGVAAAAPLETAAASTSTVATLLARDPTVTTLDNAMFGLGKGVGSRSDRPAVQSARCAGDSAICGDSDVHAGAARHRARRCRCGGIRHSLRHGDELSHGRTLRTGGDPL